MSVKDGQASIFETMKENLSNPIFGVLREALSNIIQPQIRFNLKSIPRREVLCWALRKGENASVDLHRKVVVQLKKEIESTIHNLADEFKDRVLKMGDYFLTLKIFTTDFLNFLTLIFF